MLIREVVVRKTTYQQEYVFLSHEHNTFNYELQEIVGEVYEELDRYIEKANFKKSNKELLLLMSKGVPIEVIAKKMGVPKNTIFKKIRRITLKINSTVIKEKKV